MTGTLLGKPGRLQHLSAISVASVELETLNYATEARPVSRCMQLERNNALCLAAHSATQHFEIPVPCFFPGWSSEVHPHLTSADAFAVESASALALAAALAVASASASAFALASALTLTSASALACVCVCVGGGGCTGERKLNCHITHQSLGCHTCPQAAWALLLASALAVGTGIQQLSCDGCASHAGGRQQARWNGGPAYQ